MASDNMDAGTVLNQFESLGDSCEFGFVLQHFGGNSRSLLQWAGAPLPGLIAALRARFADLYRRDDLVVIGGGQVLDRKYDLRFHAGDHAHGSGPVPRPLDNDEAALAEQAREARHIGFLTRLTLERLEQRERIFIYKRNDGLSFDDILRLKAALDLYGPQRLLCVVPADAGIGAGVVRVIATGVALGGLAAFAHYTNQEACDAPAWLALCRKALELDWGDAGFPADAALDARPPGFEIHPDGLRIADDGLAAGLLAALYQTLLLRPGDPPGLAHHAASLCSGVSTMEDMIGSFLRSTEFSETLPRFLARYRSDA